MTQLQKEQFLKIIEKYHEGNLSKEEMEFLDAYYQSFSFREGYTPDLPEDKVKLLKDDLKNTITQNIAHAQQQHSRRAKMRFYGWSISIAAALIIAGAGIFFNTGNDIVTKIAEKIVEPDIAPGGNRAILTLSNGKKISLTDADTGMLAEMAGVKITKTADGQLMYTVLDQPDANANSTANLNTIETPKGGQYQIKLPDGSNVWLNADSKLIFPSSFADQKSRRIELIGEAYFDVAKDKSKPFIVKTAGQEVEALGTQFNINSYSDESSVKTTLLHGSVRVSANTGGNKILVPGQQSSLVNNSIDVAKVDTELSIAWKNNNFVFESDDIRYIMRMIARWYNLEVEYVGAVPDDKFGGAVSRFENVSEVLKALQSTGVVKFRIEGRKIIVSK